MKGWIDMLKTTNIDVMCRPNNKKRYESKGYVWIYNTYISVKVDDLYPHSAVLVEVLCDYCLEDNIETILLKKYFKYLDQNQNAIIKKDCCIGCSPKKVRESNMLIYGSCNPHDFPDFDNKVKKTSIEKYGVEKYQQSIEIKEKIKNSFIVKFGVEHHLKLPEFREKQSNTVKEKYGVSHISQSNTIKEKVKNTQFEKYGDYYRNTEECIEKLKSSNLLKFGVEYYFQSQEFKEKFSGENSPNWQGGITPINLKIRLSPEYKEWKISVFKRDKYICQCCKNKSKKIQAHHILSFSQYPELRLDINNGITLCEDCHMSNVKGGFHNIYGTKNTTPEQLHEYIKNKNIKTSTLFENKGGDV